jgi:hypothetical protein
MAEGGQVGGGAGRMRDVLRDLVRLQEGRVGGPEAVLKGIAGPEPSDPERLAALVLTEELSSQSADLDPETRSAAMARLAITDVARGDLAGARRWLRDALSRPPARPAARAALHYNLYLVLSAGAHEDPAAGAAAAEQYRAAVEIDRSLSELPPRLRMSRVMSAVGHGKLLVLEDDAGREHLARTLDADLADESGAEMLALEAGGLPEFSHANIAPVESYRHDPPARPLLLMRMVDGMDLETATRKMLASGRRPTLLGALFEMRPLFAAVGYLHTQRPPWVLKTLCPRDVLLTRRYGLQLTDFGLSDTRLSAADAALAVYLSPEVRADRPADARADVYSLGRLMVFLLTGDPMGMDSLEAPIREVLARAVSPSPDARPPTPQALADALTVAWTRLPRVNLETVDGPCKGRKFHFDRLLTFSIGRDHRADMPLSQDHRVSRRHATLEIGVDGVVLRDLKSSNGTFINGDQLSGARPLSTGDMVLVGDTMVRVEILPAEGAAPAEGSGLVSAVAAAAAAAATQPSQAPAGAMLDAATPSLADDSATQTLDRDVIAAALRGERL